MFTSYPYTRGHCTILKNEKRDDMGLWTVDTPPTEYLTLRGIKVVDISIFTKFPEAMGRVIRETKMFGGTSLPNLLSLTAQRTN